jgi:hypothetical protein
MDIQDILQLIRDVGITGVLLLWGPWFVTTRLWPELLALLQDCCAQLGAIRQAIEDLQPTMKN